MFLALGFFNVSCFWRRFAQNAFEANSGNWSRYKRACRTCIKKPFRLCMFFAHQRQPTSGYHRVYRVTISNIRSGWYQCVHDMHGPNGLIHSRSASTSSPAYVDAVTHEGIFSETSSSPSPKPNDAKYFERAWNTGKHEEGCMDWIRDCRNENLITGRS